MDLIIRAGRNDHTVIDHFLTPTAAGVFAPSRQPIDAVVADASIAAQRPQLQRITADAGVPYLIDPVTPLLQSEQAENDSWAVLPFAHAEPLMPTDINDYILDELVERVVDFQRSTGATHLIPPYFYSNRRDDVWWRANLALLRRTGQHLSREGVNLPVIPVLAVSLREYGPEMTWERGLDAFLAATGEMNTESVALSWSWNNPTRSKRAAIALLLGATAHAASRSSIIGWRAGTFGLALAAAGASGYETGIGERESLHYVSLAASRRPKADSSPPRAQAYTYFSEFGRSLPRRAGEAILKDPRIMGSLVCNPDNACCTEGADSMIHQWREHTVRERRRELTQLETIPAPRGWRLNHIEQKAERAALLAASANEALSEAGVDVRIPTESFAAMQDVASSMRAGLNSQVA